MRKSFLFTCLIFSLIIVICTTLLALQTPFSPLFAYDGNDPKFVRQILDRSKERTLQATRYLESLRKDGSLKMVESLRKDNSLKMVESLRKDNSLKMVESLRKDSSLKMVDNSTEIYDLAVVIITKELRKSKYRDRENFMIQTLGSVLKELSENRHPIFKTYKVTLCKVVHYRNSHSTNVMEFAEIVDVVTEDQFDEPHTNIFDKAKNDYRFCMNHIFTKYAFQYILVLEDDVFMKPNSFITLGYFVQSLQLHSQKHDWMAIKLYYPKKWSGYTFIVGDLVELLATSSILGVILSIIYTTITCYYQKAHVIFFYKFFTLFSIILCLMIGRPNVMEWRSHFYFTHLLATAPGCCTQALLYNHVHIARFMKYLSFIKSSYDMPVDLAVDDFADMYDLGYYVIQPNLCQHIGFWSTFKKDKKFAIEFL